MNIELSDTQTSDENQDEKEPESTKPKRTHSKTNNYDNVIYDELLDVFELSSPKKKNKKRRINQFINYQSY